jgi:methylthioribose-1-phosphate isomerase
VPFFVSLLSPTIDWTIHDGFAEIPIEERDQREITHEGPCVPFGTVRPL